MGNRTSYLFFYEHFNKFLGKHFTMHYEVYLIYYLGNNSVLFWTAKTFITVLCTIVYCCSRSTMCHEAHYNQFVCFNGFIHDWPNVVKVLKIFFMIFDDRHKGFLTCFTYVEQPIINIPGVSGTSIIIIRLILMTFFRIFGLIYVLGGILQPPMLLFCR